MIRQLKITQTLTNRDSASLDKYMNDVNRESLITQNEEVALAIKIQAGKNTEDPIKIQEGRIALDKLVKANLRFVISVAKQYQNRGLPLSDLINEGNIGLIKAAEKFDHTRGFKFISYGVWQIRQAIMQAVSEQTRMMRVPLNKINLMNKAYQATDKLEQQLERKPSTEELSETMGTSTDTLNDLMMASSRHLSFDDNLSNRDDDERSLLSVLINKESPAADDGLILNSLKLDLARSLSTLTPIEESVVRQYFGIGIPHGLSLMEIARELALTPERIRQIKAKAIRKMKHSSRKEILRAHLG